MVRLIDADECFRLAGDKHNVCEDCLWHKIREDCLGCPMLYVKEALADAPTYKQSIPAQVERNYPPPRYGSPYRCPNCEVDLVKVEFMRFDGSEPANKTSYCWRCGQKLDWGDI